MGRPKDLSELERPDCDEWVNEESALSQKCKRMHSGTEAM